MQDIDLPLPQNFATFSNPGGGCHVHTHQLPGEVGWFAARRSAGPWLLLQRGVSVSVRWCHAGEERREGGRERALFSHPEWNLPSGCGLFPRKGKRESGKKRDCRGRENFQREGGLRKPPKCRQRAMRKWHGNRRGRFPKQGRTATGKRAGKNLGGVCRIRCNHFVHFPEVSVKIALLSRPLVTCSTFELF